MAPSNVLVALDGSPLAEDALAHALETFECRVTVLNVVTPIDGSMSEGGIIETDDERRQSARDRTEQIIEGVRADQDDDRTVETVVGVGDPAETILSFVDEHDVDHVVIGGHGGDRGRLARRLLGTVATAVVGEAPVTVTVVK